MSPIRRAIDTKMDKYIAEHKAHLVEFKAMRDKGELDFANEELEKEVKIRLDILEELKGT